MRWSFVPCLLVCLAALAAGASAQSSPFTVALVRDDGVMLPVSTYDRGRWRMPWPGPQKEADVPVRLDDCPLAWWGLRATPRQWMLWTRDEAPRRVTVDRPIVTFTYCRQQVALASRDAARTWWRPADGLRAPKQGVAVAGGDVQVVLPREVAPESPEGRALLDGLQGPFNTNERLMLAADYFARYTPSVDAAQRDRMPVRALGIHAGPGKAGDLYFVELERRYPRKQPEPLQWCDEVTFMAGWVRRASDERLDLSLIERAVTSCLLDSVLRATPHAVFRTAKGPTWLVELYRPDAEGYAMFAAPVDEAVEMLGYRSIGACDPDARPQAGRWPPGPASGEVP